ncbi:aquaporin Z [Arthrobacter pigmenti]|uniref:Aquaporin Z n=1 Tax=Arthrobacter pigmenti TaxID=271432 RepID=A0A846RX42_9MICC|nr:aquaporin [Arthrobacter pigmenti]NJC22781.1 aquaporin Z [Arthrobacter pigmenti]
MQEARSEAHVTSAARDETKPGLLTGSLIEALGAFFIVLAGFGVTMLNPQGGFGPGFAFGLAFLVVIAAFGRLSGGYFNPALTLGLAMAGKTPWRAVLPFIVAQTVGALAAASFFWLIFTTHPQEIQIAGLFSTAANGYAENSANAFPLASILLVEVVATALLTAVVLGSTGRLASRAAAPFAIGLSYAVLLTALAPLDNGGLNPARSLAAAVFAEPLALQQVWLFWVAPLLGALIAGLLYRSVELGQRVSAEKTHDDGGARDDVEPDTHPAAPAVAGSAVAAAASHHEGHNAPAKRDGETGTDEARTFFEDSSPEDPAQPNGNDNDDNDAGQTRHSQG